MGGEMTGGMASARAAWRGGAAMWGPAVSWREVSGIEGIEGILQSFSLLITRK